MSKCHTVVTRMKVSSIDHLVSQRVTKIKKKVFNPINTFSSAFHTEAVTTNDLAAHPYSSDNEPMETSYSCPPFAFPLSYENQVSVNKILQYSLSWQAEEDISDCSAFICYVIHICLKTIRITSRLDRGIRRGIGCDATPHMWIVIEDVIIDNCYSKLVTKQHVKILEKKHPKPYEKRNFLYSDSDLKVKDKEKLKVLKMKKLIDMFILFPNKAMAICLNREDLTNYFFYMIRFMWETFQVNISGIDPKVRYQCWECGNNPPLSNRHLNDIFPQLWGSGLSFSDGSSSSNFGGNPIETFKIDGAERESESSAAQIAATSVGVASKCETKEKWKFPSCGHCKVANYCSRACQVKDWENEHRFICQAQTSICLIPSDDAD